MSGAELSVVEGGLPEVRPNAPIAWTPDRVALLKRTICKGSSDDELDMFLARCKQTGLDPFARQIHAIKRWDSREKREVMSIQIGIDGFRLIAERTGRYVPGREPTYSYDQHGHLTSATAYVKKLAAGEWHEIAATAYYEEYLQTDREGNPLGLWKKMPRTMLGKVAETIALRRAFPAEMSGLYSGEEMGEAELPPPHGPRATPRHPETVPTRTIEGEVVDTTTGEISPAPAVPQRTVEAPRPQQTAPSADAPAACEICGRGLTAGQVGVSQGRFQRSLCPQHQREAAQQPQQIAPAAAPVAQPESPTIDAPAVSEPGLQQQLHYLLQRAVEAQCSLAELDLNPEGELLGRLERAVAAGSLYTEADLTNYPVQQMQSDLADLNAGLMNLRVDTDDDDEQ